MVYVLLTRRGFLNFMLPHANLQFTSYILIVTDFVDEGFN